MIDQSPLTFSTPCLILPAAMTEQQTAPSPAGQETASATSPASRWVALSLIGASLLLFAVLAYSAVVGKSATYDEPLHAFAGYLIKYHKDYRVDPEDPALFTWFASIPQGESQLKFDPKTPYMDAVFSDHANQWILAINALYQTPGSDGDALVNRSRFMFVLLGVAMGALIAVWSWRIGGYACAILATLPFAFDPNFMGHAALVKNDVPIALCLLAVMYCAWHVGTRGSWQRLLLLALALAASVNVKFSGVTFGIFVLILLIGRAMLPVDWLVLKWNLTQRWQRAVGAVAITVACAVVCWIGIWFSYGFRFSPTPGSDRKLDMTNIIRQGKFAEMVASAATTQPTVTTDELDKKPNSMVTNLVLFAEKHELLPQTWLNGLLYTHATTRLRAGYLMGNYSITGWWYFFPMAMIFKTPLPTIILAVVALGFWIAYLVRFSRPGAWQWKAAWEPLDWWTLICLWFPVAAYGLSAMSSNINLGLRHILPLYPFLFILTAIGLCRLLVVYKRIAVFVCASLIGLGLMESLSIYPDYLTFFNTFAGGQRWGYKLLSDSNIDWGQDLKLLAEWQEKNSDKPLYLCYFGTVDPKFYGIARIDLPGGWPWGQFRNVPNEPGVIAVSVTNLQGTYLTPESRAAYQQLMRVEPRERLGGSIYLWDWPLRTTGPGG